MHLSVRIYVCLVTLAATLVILADRFSWVTKATAWQVVLVLVLVIVCAAGEHVSFQVHSGFATHAGTVPHLATALLLPPGPAGLVAALGMAIYVMNRRPAPLKAVFNTANVVLSVEAASLAFSQLGGPDLLIGSDDWRGLLATAVSSGA